MILGADEAGRGPVIGNMVLCGVAFKSAVLDELKQAGVRDSKLISPRRRVELARLVGEKADGAEIVEISPAQIDESLLVKKVNLNELEAKTFALIIDRLRPELAYLDSPDPDPKMFERRVRKYLSVKPKLIVENFADRKYVAVAAASILAKVRRDQGIRVLCERYGDFGTGYPADHRTVSFLERWVREKGELPDFARRSWKTARRIEAQAKQRRID